MNNNIEFIDRALEEDELSHWRCKKCGLYLHPDMAYSHICNPLILKIKESRL